ncbi:hypothetical protein EJ08DRAFT_427775 [Tothia fuscella]|uniref:Uncharacterized protein n=1 Tax=Tothia fuscella TaxID=1048955 RepID=A0A9P4P0J2_9PEZI|nr:hypothetical protein EJ08DRAFT_427775 [Tothia fuscella]
MPIILHILHHLLCMHSFRSTSLLAAGNQVRRRLISGPYSFDSFQRLKRGYTIKAFLRARYCLWFWFWSWVYCTFSSRWKAGFMCSREIAEVCIELCLFEYIFWRCIYPFKFVVSYGKGTPIIMFIAPNVFTFSTRFPSL